MEWGPHEKALRERAKREGVVPKALTSKPQLTPLAAYGYGAFQFLGRFRTWDGMSGTPGPIPLDAILAYARMQGINSRFEVNELVELVSGTDLAYRNRMAGKAQSKMGAKSAPPRAGPRRPTRGVRR